MSKFNRYFKYTKLNEEDILNLHEECLLKYLSNTAELSDITELMRLNNLIIAKKELNTESLVKSLKLSYSTIRM
ncbi:MAG: hypothetical protein MJ237_04970 [bacterium]|nr:hypothetical protein [bacterium]